MKQNFYKQNHLIEGIREPTLFAQSFEDAETLARLNPKNQKNVAQPTWSIITN
ncbi:hypothetical protein G6M26_30785 [Agrobacterium tumefaciens]|nr:hypothetical protein [Agrobacterium tumefaciens]NTE22938.1 hypothetical protein [Agrobacterium tumefaciens]